MGKISWELGLVLGVSITFLNHSNRVRYSKIARWFLDVVGKGPDHGFTHFNDDALKDLEAHSEPNNFAVKDLDSELDVLC